jgi:hypothetical protein
MLLTADMPVHPLLPQSNRDQVLSLAIIAPLSSSSINERLRHFRYPKIKADEPSLMLHPHARVRAEPWQNLGRAVNRPIIDDDDFVCGIDLFKATPAGIVRGWSCRGNRR